MLRANLVPCYRDFAVPGCVCYFNLIGAEIVEGSLSSEALPLWFGPMQQPNQPLGPARIAMPVTVKNGRSSPRSDDEAAYAQLILHQSPDNGQKTRSSRAPDLEDSGAVRALRAARPWMLTEAVPLPP